MRVLAIEEMNEVSGGSGRRRSRCGSKSWGKGSGKSSGKGSGKSSGKCSGKSSGKDSGKSSGKDSGKNCLPFEPQVP